jgi:hypothetical protein
MIWEKFPLTIGPGVMFALDVTSIVREEEPKGALGAIVGLTVWVGIATAAG